MSQDKDVGKTRGGSEEFDGLKIFEAVFLTRSNPLCLKQNHQNMSAASVCSGSYSNTIGTVGMLSMGFERRNYLCVCTVKSDFYGIIRIGRLR